MKTKAINQLTSALLAMFVIILFAFSACSSDDPPGPVPIDDDPDVSYYNPGETIPGDDFPYITMPQLITSVMDVGDEIGEPVLADVAKWKGDLVLNPQRFRAQSFTGLIKRYTGDACTDPEFSWYDSNSWTDDIASSDFTFNPSGLLCFASTSRVVGSDWKWVNPTNKKFMIDGEWKQFLTQAGYFIKGGYEYYKSTNAYLFPDVDIYMSKHRLWELDHDENFTGPYDYIFKRTTFSGICSTTTEITSWSVTAGIAGELAEGLVGSLSATYGETNINSTTVKEEITTSKTTTYKIPAGERWRFITLKGIERYTFTNSEGNPWESDNTIKSVFEFDQNYNIGLINNHTTTLHLIIKYPN